MEIYRPGDFRVCPSCGARHKVQDLRCGRCTTSLVGAPVRHAAPVRPRTVGVASSRTVRAMMVAGVVLALAAGLWVRSVFRGAALEQSVSAAPRPIDAPPAPPVAAPDWTPPALSYPATPPLRPALTAIPSSTASPMAGVPLTPMVGTSLPASVPAPVPAVEAPSTGMVSIAPSAPRPSGRTTVTDDDLARVRTQGGAGLPPAGTAGAGAAAGPGDDVVRDWTVRVRDRQGDVQEAQARARGLETEIAALKARASVVTDEGDREKVDRDLQNALSDLERAARSVRDAERRLDETKADARREGVRVQ
jgi:hypothetical protein